MPDLISIAAFNERESAEKLTTRLCEAGYIAELYDETLEQKWHLFQVAPHAQFRVRVVQTEDEEALKQLQAWEKSGKDDYIAHAVHCPDCQSTLVEYPQFSRRTLVGALPAIAAAAGIVERDYYCENCQFTWPAEPPPAPPEVDPLNWPKSWKV